ncbi:MAG: hypothetical protein Q8S39_14965 [Ignavibacteria bacterium]|nr:hypothetical protein [Ignavibacteria bacterium]
MQKEYPLDTSLLAARRFIAELYNDNDENYGGAVPMVGYGAGAYILTINNYYNK